MRRPILMIVLALGSVLGFGSGIARIARGHCAPGHFESRSTTAAVPAATTAPPVILQIVVPATPRTDP
jgi:hypothetical protein